MLEKTLLGHVRERIGAPNKGDLSDDRLRGYVADGAERLATELESFIKTDELSVALVANQNEYAVPSDLLTILWVEHNNLRLDEIGINAEDRDGTNWRNQTASTPTSYAMQGRKLILVPKPSAAAVSTDGFLSIRYIASAPTITAAGPPTWSDADQWLLIYLTALTFCEVNPSQENQARIPRYELQVAGRLDEARGRWQNMTRFYHARLRPETGGRTGGSR